MLADGAREGLLATALLPARRWRDCPSLEGERANARLGALANVTQLLEPVCLAPATAKGAGNIGTQVQGTLAFEGTGREGGLDTT